MPESAVKVPDMSHPCVVGAGAIGGGVGALLHLAGQRVTLVARGAHLEAMRSDGLELATPAGRQRLAIDVSPTVPSDTSLVLLAVKQPDLPGALAAVPRGCPVVCLQNGITAPARADCAGHPAIAAMVYLPATHMSPGQVLLHGHPHPGVIDVGPCSDGTEAWARAIAEMLRGAGLESVYRPDIMDWKRGKLLINLAGGLQAACGEVDGALHDRLMDEAIAVYAAEGVGWIEPAALRARASLRSAAAGGEARPGNSMWQSIARGRVPEVDAIYHDIAAAARRVGLDAPTCRRLAGVVAELEHPGRHSPEALAALLLDERPSAAAIRV